MSFGREPSPQQLHQAQILARKKMVTECELVGQPVPKVLIVTEEERLKLCDQENPENDSIVIDIEDVVVDTGDLPQFPTMASPQHGRTDEVTAAQIRPKPLSKKLPQLVVAKSQFFKDQMGLKIGGPMEKNKPMLYVTLSLFAELLSNMKYDLNQLMTHMLFYDERNKLTKVKIEKLTIIHSFLM